MVYIILMLIKMGEANFPLRKAYAQ